MTYLPRASMICAARVAPSLSREPIALILPFSIQMDRPSAGLSATPSMTVASAMSKDMMGTCSKRSELGRQRHADGARLQDADARPEYGKHGGKLAALVEE